MSTCNYDYKTKVFSYKYYFSFFFVYNPQDKYLRQEIRKRSFFNAFNCRTFGNSEIH